MTTVDDTTTEVQGPPMDVYGGVGWNAVSAWGHLGIQFAIGIVLARLFLAQDHRPLAMATSMVLPRD